MVKEIGRNIEGKCPFVKGDLSALAPLAILEKTCFRSTARSVCSEAVTLCIADSNYIVHCENSI